MLTEALSKTCGNCEANEKKKTLYNETFKSQHDCHINHHGSAGSMEGAGVVQYSETNYDTQLVLVVTPALTPVVKANPHPGIDIAKKIVGDSQKRLGARCRNLKKQ